MSNAKHNLIIRNSSSISSGNIKAVEMAKTRNFPNSKHRPPKIIHGFALPQIAIRSERGKRNRCSEVVLVNGSWDVTHQIPSIVAEMHNVHPQDSLNDDVQLDSPNFQDLEPAECDPDGFTDSNLSWLLNYKIHELPPVPGDDDYYNDDNKSDRPGRQQNFSFTKPCAIFDKEIRETYKDGVEKAKIQTHPYQQQSNQQQGRVNSSGVKKPPFTYTELIEHALSERGELTVSGIYQWISDHFSFYKHNDDRWKNSVRHNLSINPHFRKGGKAVHGAGHLWTLALRDDTKTIQMRQRMQQFIQTHSEISREQQEQEEFDRELQAATASILGELDGSQTPNPEIEVEFINVVDVPNADGLEDFLSPPVSKQELVQECGLVNDYLITDLNPTALGLNLVEGEATTTERTLYDDIPFEYYEMEAQ